MDVKLVKFKNLNDFKRRIAALWANQKENEVYEFEFPDKETEDEFNEIKRLFNG